MYEDYCSGGGDNHLARLAYPVGKKFNEKVALTHNLEYLPSLEDLSDFNVNTPRGCE